MDMAERVKIRLDVHVLGLFPSLSRASVQKLIDEGRVAVDGEAQTKSGYKVKIGSKVKVDYDPDNLPDIPAIDLPVLYEDDDCVVIDKPIGLLSHSKGAFNPEATVATWLSQPNPTRLNPVAGFNLVGFGKDRNGIVHRLDRATSGVMICAKTPEALAWLQKQFSARKVKKIYIALITDELDPAEAIIDMPIERNPASPQRFRVGVNGKSAVTHYKTIRKFTHKTADYSLVELKPITGRTHQLRVHLAHQGYPIVGDTFYEGQQAKRLYLHAYSLEITLPSRIRKGFISEIPVDFTKPEKT